MTLDEITRLRQELDEARARWQNMREALAIPDDWEPYIEPEERRIAAFVKDKAADAEHQRGKQAALVVELDEARAEIARLIDVYHKAEAWRRQRNFEYRRGEINPHLLTAHHEDLDLAHAVDAYRASTPDEAGAR